MDTVYVIYINADSTEGRGPMILDIEAGFFTNEKQATAYAEQLPGVQGIKGSNGDVKVRPIMKHDPDLENKKLKLTQEIEARKLMYQKLTGNRYPG